MNQFAKKILSRGIRLNRQVNEAAANSIDWVFKRDTMIQSGRTWFELVHDGDLMAVRYYELPDEHEISFADGSVLPIERNQHQVPLVLVPPLGVTTETFDLMPQRSLVRYMAACGFKVYLIDWGKPQKEHAHFGLTDYAERMMTTALTKIRRHSGSKDLSLMGWCMGGLLCLLYQGLAKDKYIRNIVTVASPIDLETGKGAIAMGAAVLDAPAKLVSNYSNFRVNSLNPERLSTPNWLTTLAFKLTDPVGSVTTYLDLMTNMADREFVESHTTTSDYLNNMLRYPGGVVQDMMSSVVLDNQLAKGKVHIADRVAELDTIVASMLVFAGETDVLVPAEVAEKIVDIVLAKDKEFRVAPGGHMGVIIGSKALNAVWKESAQWLAERSAAKAVKKVKAKRKV